MSIRFLPLATLSIGHDFYSDGRCRDFDFVLAADGRAQLATARLLARSRDGRLHLLFEAADDGTPLLPMSGQILRVGLRLNHRQFANFTTPTLANGWQLACYSNRVDPTALAAPIAALPVGDLYAPAPRLAKRPLGLRLRDASGVTLAEQTVTGVDAAAFDLRPYGFGHFTVDEDDGDEQHATAFYRHPEFAAASLYGVVDIHLHASLHATPAALEVDFTARSEILSYYVVAQRYGASEFNQLAVADNGFAEDSRAEVKFDRLASDIDPALLGGTTENTLLFRSQVPVARSERGLRKIQLARGNSVLVEHLPQPGAERVQAQHVIHLSKP